MCVVSIGSSWHDSVATQWHIQVDSIETPALALCEARIIAWLHGICSRDRSKSGSQYWMIYMRYATSLADSKSLHSPAILDVSVVASRKDLFPKLTKRKEHLRWLTSLGPYRKLEERKTLIYHSRYVLSCLLKWDCHWSTMCVRLFKGCQIW